MAPSAFQRLVPAIALAFAALPARADFTLTNDSSQVAYVRGKQVIVIDGELRLQINPKAAPGQTQSAWSASAPRQFATFEGVYDTQQSLKTLVCALPPGGTLTVSCRGRNNAPVMFQNLELVLCGEAGAGLPAETKDGWTISHHVVAGEGSTLVDDLADILSPRPALFRLETLPSGKDMLLKDPKPIRTCVIL